jgi:hypothetical protein
LRRCASSAGDAPSSATVGAVRGNSFSARSISLARALAIATGSSSLPRSASACSVITWRTMLIVEAAQLGRRLEIALGQLGQLGAHRERAGRDVVAAGGDRLDVGAHGVELGALGVGLGVAGGVALGEQAVARGAEPLPQRLDVGPRHAADLLPRALQILDLPDRLAPPGLAGRLGHDRLGGARSACSWRRRCPAPGAAGLDRRLAPLEEPRRTRRGTPSTARRRPCAAPAPTPSTARCSSFIATAVASKSVESASACAAATSSRLAATLPDSFSSSAARSCGCARTRRRSGP